MTWNKESIDAWKAIQDKKRKQERRYTDTPICPSCGGAVLFKNITTRLTKNEDFGPATCLCGQLLVVEIHVPRPTYSTYTKEYVTEMEEAAEGDESDA